MTTNRSKIKVEVVDKIKLMSSISNQTQQKRLVYAPPPTAPYLLPSILEYYT